MGVYIRSQPIAKISSNLIFLTGKDRGMIKAYDLTSKEYIEINPMTKSGDFDVDGERICFLSVDEEIYCHVYDSNYDYSDSEFDFGSKVVGGYDFVNNDDNPLDDQGHGTHVAATAAGNGILKGVAPEAQIYDYKVLNSGGGGSINWVIAGIEKAVDPNGDGDFSDHVDIISMSLGGRGNPDDPMSKAIDNAVDAGIIAVIAAGNSGPREQTIGSPGTSRKAITVGAIDKNNNLAYFSSKGPVIWEDENREEQLMIKPDIVAPGVNICAAQSLNKPWDNLGCLDNEHVAISGTSMATPHIAGVVALLKQKNPGLTSYAAKYFLMNGAQDLGYLETEQGAGVVNVSFAIQSILKDKGEIEEIDIPPSNCRDTCKSLNYECGMHLVCNEVVDCGACLKGIKKKRFGRR